MLAVLAVGALIWHVAGTRPAQLWVLGVMLGLSQLIEFVYRTATGREITAIHPRNRG